MKIFIAIVLAFIIADVLIVTFVIYKRLKKKLSASLIEKIRTEWKRIIRQSDRRHAIMDADKLLDFTMTQMGITGNMGAKLKKSPHLFKDINGVWKAHKVRNDIAHKIDFKVTEKIYKETMLYFKMAFKDLKIF
jgi:hypothetical protein